MKMSHPDTDLTIDVAEHLTDSYETQGWRKATVDAPAGNASLGDWQAFARQQGMSGEDIEGLSRDDIRAALS